MQHVPVEQHRAARRWALRLGKVLVTIGVVYVLARDVEGQQLRGMLVAADPRWLLLGLSLKTFSLMVHDVRTWQALPPKRPPLGPVLVVGLAMSLLNAVLPARAGDVALVAALRSRFGVPATTGAAVIGVVSVVEAGALAVVILCTLALGAASWADVLGEGVVVQSTLLLAGALCGAALGAVVVIGLARALRGRQLPGHLALLQRLVEDAAALFSSVRRLGGNMALAMIQVFALVLAFSTGLPALGIDIPDPVLTASGILALSALAGFVLPSTWGAGPAAASAALLAPQGVSDEGILLYAGAYWLIAHVPVLATGLPCMWWERRPATESEAATETTTGAPPEGDAPATDP
ncbi:MAG: flippase-like domain-containing protein [Alphaproteobacteria bacterium]|nr:flippase-like domain-containing protein [Alphaproteobacteria bacterium]